jgi:hypothetical protein
MPSGKVNGPEANSDDATAGATFKTAVKASAAAIADCLCPSGSGWTFGLLENDSRKIPLLQMTRRSWRKRCTRFLSQ